MENVEAAFDEIVRVCKGGIGSHRDPLLWV
jgi:hypothetical protein